MFEAAINTDNCRPLISVIGHFPISAASAAAAFEK